MAPGSAADVDSGHPRRVLLADVCRAVLDGWPDEGRASREEVRAELERLIAWTEEPETDPSAGPEDGDRFLQRRLNDALRLECLRRWEEEPERYDPAACLDLLATLERRQRRTLPRDARDFASRIADPDGFELLVELAHDLRSPLTSVSFMSETLRGGFSGEVNEQQRHQLGLIYSAALAMQSTVTDVMDLARQGGDLLDEPEVPFSLRDTIDNVVKTVAPIADVKGLEIRTDFPESDRVSGRPLILGRILLNLVTNALKFTERGHVEIAVRHVGNGEVEFSVRDTGRGIDEANLRTMYEPFRKARDRKGSFFSGSGLGLAIVRRLVTALESELEVDTRPDWGTRFFFRTRLPSISRL